MPNYLVTFDTDRGNVTLKTDLYDADRFSEILVPMISQFAEKKGGRLRGNGPPIVYHKGKALDPNVPICQLHLDEGDTLLISCQYQNG